MLIKKRLAILWFLIFIYNQGLFTCNPLKTAKKSLNFGIYLTWPTPELIGASFSLGHREISEGHLTLRAVKTWDSVRTLLGLQGNRFCSSLLSSMLIKWKDCNCVNHLPTLKGSPLWVWSQLRGKSRGDREIYLEASFDPPYPAKTEANPTLNCVIEALCTQLVGVGFLPFTIETFLMHPSADLPVWLML